MQVYNDELYHVGVIGMHWKHHKKVEVPIEIRKASDQVSKNKEKLKEATKDKFNSKRINDATGELKYSKEDLAKVSILNKLSKKGKSTSQLKMEEKYKQKGLSDDDAAVSAYNNIRTKKILAVVGTVALTAAVGYGTYKFRDNNVDKIIKSGSSLQNIAKESDKGLRDTFYASSNKLDKLKYKGLYGSTLKDMGEGVVNKEIKALSDIKQASPKNAMNALSELMKKDPKFAEDLKKQIQSGDNILSLSTAYSKKIELAKNSLDKGLADKHVYELFNAGLVDHSPSMQKLTDQYFSSMAEKGYNAIRDVNDSKYSGFGAANPIIAFNTKGKVGISDIKKLTNNEIAKANNVATGVIVGSNYAKQGAVAVASYLGITGLSNASAKRKSNIAVNKYKTANQTSKLTNTEIARMLERRK